MTPTGNVEDGSAVMPMAVSPDAKHLYAVIRSQPYRVLSYEIDARTGILREKAAAALPITCLIFRSRNLADFFFASYGGNTITSLRMDEDGLVKDSQAFVTGWNAHPIVSDRTGKYVFVSNLGPGVVLQYILNAETGMSAEEKGYHLPTAFEDCVCRSNGVELSKRSRSAHH
ncbi:beta-propeller fold lactonase family protein [Rhizobium skierniewicense]|nr:beta-propeller fold lactonase family protein [Rhizobium skierniewicense]